MAAHFLSTGWGSLVMVLGASVALAVVVRDAVAFAVTASAWALCRLWRGRSGGRAKA